MKESEEYNVTTAIENNDEEVLNKCQTEQKLEND